MDDVSTLYARFAAHVANALDALETEGQLALGLDRAAVAVEPPRDAGHGDLATNAAMVLAKRAGRCPRPLGPPSLSGGARPAGRRDPRRPLSRRLPEAGGRRPRRRVRRSLRRRARERVAGDLPPPHRRGDARPHQDGPRWPRR